MRPYKIATDHPVSIDATNICCVSFSYQHTYFLLHPHSRPPRKSTICAHCHKGQHVGVVVALRVLFVEYRKLLRLKTHQRYKLPVNEVVAIVVSVAIVFSRDCVLIPFRYWFVYLFLLFSLLRITQHEVGVKVWACAVVLLFLLQLLETFIFVGFFDSALFHNHIFRQRCGFAGINLLRFIAVLVLFFFWIFLLLAYFCRCLLKFICIIMLDIFNKICKNLKVWQLIMIAA